MTISATKGPLVVFGSSGSADANEHLGPSLFYQGAFVLDPRTRFTYVPGQSESWPCYGFSSGEITAINAVPSALAANNIAASQSPGAGAITLVSSSGAGITVGVSITRADTGATVSGLLAIDDVATPVYFGSANAVAIWDPAKMVARAVRIVSGGNDSGITFTVNGYDVYGYPMTETITGANASTATGKKAFKYIASVTHTGTVAGTVTIGTTDIIGLPLRCDAFGDLRIVYNNAVVTASTGFLAADTATATATTGDVRGTYTLQTASDGSRRLQVFITPSLANLADSNVSKGLFGVTQF